MEKILYWLKEKKIFCCFIFLSILCATFASLYIVEVSAEEAYVCPKALVQEEISDVLVVDIKGEVINPGVYRVQEDAIIQDVIVLAGGLTEQADTSNLNLSKIVSNEMVITVYSKEEIASEKKLEAIQTTETEEKSSLINLNNASLEELMTLPGIGEAKAKLIIQYRTNCGLFTSIEELKNIKGIGESIYLKLEPYITI